MFSGWVYLNWKGFGCIWLFLIMMQHGWKVMQLVYVYSSPLYIWEWAGGCDANGNQAPYLIIGCYALLRWECGLDADPLGFDGCYMSCAIGAHAWSEFWSSKETILYLSD
ncbi:hypothetical protein R6Q57_020704 [Mikania cordata]